jgi:hypothetical protein
MSYLFYKLVVVHAQPEDDIDRLFTSLVPFEPADEMVAHILARIRHLPAVSVSSVVPSSADENERRNLEDASQDALIVLNEQRNLLKQRNGSGFRQE